MIDAVFISDLHLHPKEFGIAERFATFIAWAKHHTKQIYILGDLIHAWPGDDNIDDWSLTITQQLAELADCGINLYYLHGNRDFLIGKRFAQLAKLTVLKEPTVIELDNQRVLLMHGDAYCLNDKSHQRFRKLTRNPIFSHLFGLLPLTTRIKLVSTVRQHSQSNRRKSSMQMDVVIPAILTHMQQMNAPILIHGHTHNPGLNIHQTSNGSYQHYILSDWDDKPQLLCYHKSKGFYFIHLEGC